MPWQKVVQHVSDSRIVVESKSGNQYPVETERERYGKQLYEQLVNDAHDHKTYWGFVQFKGDDGPVMIDWCIGEKDVPPEKAPWEH